MFNQAWRRWLANWFGSGNVRPARRKRSVLSVELLEDRTVPAVFNVTTLADVVDPNDGVLSLREAIHGFNASADADNTINLTLAGTYQLTGSAGEDNNESGDFDLFNNGTTTLTINGISAASTVIDAASNDRIFHIFGSGITLTLNDMTLTNGFVHSDGGAIHARGSTLNVNRVTLESNTAEGEYGGEGRGGAIFSKHVVNVVDSTFQSNVAQGSTSDYYGYFSSGGGARGGAIYNSNGDVFVSGSFFLFNRAEGGDGDEYGGGNGGDASGGAIYNRRGTLRVFDTDFTENEALAGRGFTGFSYGYGAGSGKNGGSFAVGGEARGGAIANDNGILDVIRSTFDANFARGGDGVYSGGSGEADGGDAYGGAISHTAGFNNSFDNSLWIGTDNTSALDILNTDRNGNILRTISTTEASGVAIDPDTRTLYLGTSGSSVQGDLTPRITPYDLESLSAGTAFNLPLPGQPRFLYEDMAFDGTHIWRVIVDGLAIQSSVVKIDPTTGSVVDSFTLNFAALGIAWDGSGLWISDFFSGQVSRFDTDGNATGESFVTGLFRTGGLAWDSTDNTLFVGTIGSVHHFTTTGAALGSFSLPETNRFADGLEFQGSSVRIINSTFAGSIPDSEARLLGPSEYLAFDDSSAGDAVSPFKDVAFSYFHLEDFEDHALNVPGVTVTAGGLSGVSSAFGPTIHDSVDADDGVIDGSGLNGDAFFSSPGSTGIRFTFDASVLGSLPTHAGIVWTDGLGQVTFQAFGPNGELLGTIGPVSDASFPDGSVNGETEEDRFFGVINPGGISAIFISNSVGGIEVDHLQYGRARFPGNTARGGDATGVYGGNGGGGDAFGGGLYAGGYSNIGSVEIIHATFAHNEAHGGSVEAGDERDAVTISEYSGDGSGFGGGIATGNGFNQVQIRATIVALNRADIGLDVFGDFNSLGSNLIGIGDGSNGFTHGANHDIVGTFDSPEDPGLDPFQLRDNGGKTRTVALLSGSQAIDAVFEGIALSEDQRGVPRPQGIRSDIGAYELQVQAPPRPRGIPYIASDDPALALSLPPIPRNTGVVDTFFSIDPFHPNTIYVNNLYATLLGRSADEAGLVAWLRALNAGWSRQAVANAISESPEGRAFFVRNLYLTYLGRSPDSGGSAYWVHLLNLGVSRERVEAGIAGSSEAFAVMGGNPASYVDGLYLRILGRSAEPEGSAYWQSLLNAGRSRAEVALGILVSPEAHTFFVTRLYVNLLGRTPSPGEVAPWVNAILGGVKPSSVLAAILGSEEYYL